MSSPTKNWLDERPGPVEIDLVSFGSKGRLQVRQPGRGLVGWLGGSTALSVVVELAESGRLIIRPWVEFGEKLLTRQRELTAELPNTGSRLALIAIRERFLRSTIETSGRFVLGDRELQHLLVHNNEPVYIVCAPELLEIWSCNYRNDFHNRIFYEMGLAAIMDE